KATRRMPRSSNAAPCTPMRAVAATITCGCSKSSKRQRSFGQSRQRIVNDPSRRHLEPTRREMLKTVALAATSAVLSNSSLPLAQGRAPRRPQRVAVIDVSHWHSVNDASYLRILQGYKLDIVGVSDGNKAIADDRAARFNSVAFTSYRE